jgi:hypothetical protein
MHPLVFSLVKEAQIELKESNPHVQWSPTAILAQCQLKSHKLFDGLKMQVIERWIDRLGLDAPKWSAAVLEKVGMRGYTPHSMSTCHGIFDKNPKLK